MILESDSLPLTKFFLHSDMGHDARKVSGAGRSMMGRAQIIQKVPHPDGRLVWAASSDPRGDGHAVAQI